MKKKMSTNEFGVDLKVHSYLVVLFLRDFKQCFFTKH